MIDAEPEPCTRPARTEGQRRFCLADRVCRARGQQRLESIEMGVSRELEPAPRRRSADDLETAAARDEWAEQVRLCGGEIASQRDPRIRKARCRIESRRRLPRAAVLPLEHESERCRRVLRFANVRPYRDQRDHQRHRSIERHLLVPPSRGAGYSMPPRYTSTRCGRVTGECKELVIATRARSGDPKTPQMTLPLFPKRSPLRRRDTLGGVTLQRITSQLTD